MYLIIKKCILEIFVVKIFLIRKTLPNLLNMRYTILVSILREEKDGRESKSML